MYVGKKNHPRNVGEDELTHFDIIYIFSDGVETQAPTSFSFPPWFHGGGFMVVVQSDLFF